MYVYDAFVCLCVHIGLDQDDELALYWYSRASAAGFPQGQSPHPLAPRLRYVLLFPPTHIPVLYLYILRKL